MTESNVDPLRTPVHSNDAKDSLVYARLLLQCGRGYPLWNPQPINGPNVKVPERAIGEGHNIEVGGTGTAGGDIESPNGVGEETQIGDVGVLTEDGGFVAFFNVVNEDLNKRRDVPQNLQTVQISYRPIFDDRDFPGALFIPKTDPPPQLKPAKGGGTKYEVTFHDKQVKLPIRNSAALTVFTDPLFPESATVERRVAESLRSHAQSHHKGWMDFVRRYEGFEGTESIFLVTGYTKTRSWAAALMCRETGKVNPWSVTFKQPDDQSEPISVSPGAKTSRDFKCRGTTGASTAQQPKQDQTLFIHGLLITRRFTRTRILDTTNDKEKLGFSLKNSFNSAFLSGKLRSGRIQSSGGGGRGTGRVQSGEGSQESG